MGDRSPNRAGSGLHSRAFRFIAATLIATAAVAFVARFVGASMAARAGNHAGNDVGRATPAQRPSIEERGGSSLSAASSTAAASRAQPHSLSGSIAPRLPLDVRGHLARTRAARDFFDYFLTARREMTPEALDAMVRRAIGAQLEGSDAQSEALDLWQRYRRYLAGLAELAPLQSDAVGSNAGRNPDALQAAFDARASLANRTMGASWSEAFFGEQWRATAYSLARLRIGIDPTLTEAQRVARLAAWRQSLPADERVALEREASAQATVDTIATLTRDDRSADALRAQATQALGAEVAERVVRMRREDDAWRARYADYATQRASIDAMGLSPEEHNARVTQLRQRIFSSVGERVRAAALDAGATR